MITITTSGSSIVFEFDDNQHYLQNGTIEVPVNSLMLVTDDSGMFTFKKSSTNDIFLSGLYTEIGMTKDELIAFYKENMVGEQGGGSSSGITSGEVQTMIDESISGKADSSAVTEDIAAAVSGKVDTSAITSSVTSASTDSELPTAKAVYDALGESGKPIEAGRGISITTGQTADTVSFNLPISAGRGQDSVIIGYSGNTAEAAYSLSEGYGAKANGQYTHAEGYYTQANGSYAHAEGESTTASSASSHAEGYHTTASGYSSHAEGNYTTAFGYSSHAEGHYTTASGESSHAEGTNTTANGYSSHAEGQYTTTNNSSEHASGKYNVSNKANTTFGDSGNTLFSVGNGTADNARHNAFEIRQNGDIYLTKDGQDVKLQDQLGGGITSGEVQTMIDESTSGITTDVNTISGKVNTNEEVTARALNTLNGELSGKVDTTTFETYSGSVATELSGKQDTLIAGSGITIDSANTISVTGGSITIDPTLDSGSTNAVANSAITTAIDAKANKGVFSGISITSMNGHPGAKFNKDNGDSNVLWLSRINGTSVFETGSLYTQAKDFSLVETSAITSAITSGSTDAQVPSAKAVHDQLGGLKFEQLTQSEYDDLVSGGTVDSSTIYFIVNNS